MISSVSFLAFSPRRQARPALQQYLNATLCVPDSLFACVLQGIGTHSTPITPALARLGPAAVATGTGDASYYLEHSIDEDVIVMNSLTDWSLGASGIAAGGLPGLPGVPGVGANGGGLGGCGGWGRGSVRASRSLLMPQIAEAATEGPDGVTDSTATGGAAEQQQLLQRHRQQDGGEQQLQQPSPGHAAAEAQLASLEGQAKGLWQQ
jgi:hypothetical protein